MATATKHGAGTRLERSNEDANAYDIVWTLVAEIMNIGGPSLTRDMVDATNMDSTDATREFIGGLIDSGEVSLDMHFLPADSSHQNLLAAVQETTAADVVRGYRLVWPVPCATGKTFTTTHAAETATITGHGWHRGDAVQLTTTDTLPAGWSLLTTYYIRPSDANTMTLHTTRAGAMANTGTVAITDDGTGTHTMTRQQTYCEFEASTTAFEPSTPFDGKMTASATLKISGVPVFEYT